jgi:hypothetical protein
MAAAATTTPPTRAAPTRIRGFLARLRSYAAPALLTLHPHVQGHPMQHCQSILTLTCLAALGAGATAQVNPFVFYPQDPERQQVTCTSFVGRPDVANAAEALLEFHEDKIRAAGGGEVGHGVMRIFGVYHWVADERLATPEIYDVVVRHQATTGGPDMSAAGAVFEIVGLSTPPSTSSARGTWIMYDCFNTPGGFNELPPPVWYVGVRLPANPAWPATDGHSLFRADMLTANTGAAVGEEHGPHAQTWTWAGLQGAPSFRTPWSYILGPFLTTPTLHVGGIDPTSTRLGAQGANLSLNGAYPDVRTAGQTDGLMLRMQDNLAPFGWAFFGGSLGFLPRSNTYFHYPLWGPLIGWCHIGDPTTVLTLGVVQLQNGARYLPLVAPNVLTPALTGVSIAFQGVVWDANTGVGDWSSAQLVRF